MAAAERRFRAPAEFFRGGTEFSFSGNESDRDALWLGTVQEFRLCKSCEGNVAVTASLGV
jgi:hypothetical protein